MHVQLLFPSKFLRCADLQGKDVTVQITSVEMDDLRCHGGKTERKPVMRMATRNGKALDKRLVLNKTNATTIAGMHGNETDAWHGHLVTLYPTKAQFGGKSVDCIRVREKAPQVGGQS